MNRLSFTGKVVLAVVVVLGLFAIVGMYNTSGREASVKVEPRQVRWLLSHQPTSVFDRAAAVFAEVLEKESGGTLTVDVVTPEEVGVMKGDIPNVDVFRYLDQGTVELATTYTVGLGNDAPLFWSLNLPFLFGSYAQAGTILDGSAGRSVLDAASQTSAHALAFTMSGGFRIIASKNTKITSLSDLKGKRIATSGGPVAEATLKALGAVPVPTNLENGAPVIDVETIDGIETTYSRLSAVVGSQTEYVKYVNETNHSLFLTTILAGNAFYDSLSDGDKTALQKAALAAAAVEREDSITLGEQTKEVLKKNGSIIVAPADIPAFRSAVQSVYEKFTPTFGAELITDLQGQ